ncbi:MAG: Phage integrase family protein [Candidatus Argoarchaeum ethanivorans]|nr:MAG: Phage integrase family protein [Candidatus Argoarchaeum ethanivorans]
MPHGGIAWTDEKDMTNETIKKILAHGDIKTRALILTLVSSGMRIGEALQVGLGDLGLDHEPPQINIRGSYTKTGERRTVFISQEARECVNEWMRVRTQYLKQATKKCNGIGTTKKIDGDERVFPFSDSVVRQLWSHVLRDAGLYEIDTSTNRVKYRIHGLRKFFRSNLTLSVPVDIVEALMGHSNYLTSAYRRYSQKQLGEAYQKGERHLTILESGDLTRLQEQVEKTGMLVDGYKHALDSKDRDIDVLSQRVDRLESLLQGLVDVACGDPDALKHLKDFIPEALCRKLDNHSTLYTDS